MFCFDPNQARALGLKHRAAFHAPHAALAATAVAALQTVGASLVVAMLVTPGATAYLLTDRFGKMIGIAVSMGSGCSLVGAYASYFFNGSTGGCIVMLQTMLFLIAFVFAPKHGILPPAPTPRRVGRNRMPNPNNLSRKTGTDGARRFGFRRF